MLEAADAAAPASGPLSAPRLRVQGADIILEDAASPKAADPGSTPQPAGGGGGDAANAAPAAVVAKAGLRVATSGASPPSGGNDAHPSATAQQLHAQQQQAAQPPAPQQQQQPQPAPPHLPAAPQQHHLVAAARASQSHELELQLRLASRTATGISNMALASSRPTQQQVNSGGGQADDRLRGHDGGALGPGSSAPGAVEGPVRMKYRSTLTEENVAYLNKLDQYTSSRPDAGGRSSSERIWRWLEGSGPPFDNPPPSLGVPPVAKGAATNPGGARRHGEKRGSGGGLFSCFGACFGGGAGSTAVR